MVLKNAVIQAIASVIYVTFVGTFLFYAPQIFITQYSALIPIAMLLLLVFSAALMGVLIFGRPIIWYLDGRKKEALTLLAYTLGIILAVTLLAFFALLLYSSVR